MNRKVVIKLEDLSEDAFESRFGQIVGGMQENAYFEDPWFAVGEGPTWAELSAGLAAYVDAKGKAADGDKQKIAIRNDLRATWTAALKQVGKYVNFKADGNVAMLESSGFEVSKERGPVSTLPPDAPQNLKLKHGELPHSLIASCKKPAGQVSFETQINGGNPNLDADWKPGAFTTSCTRIELTGLTGGTIYAVRTRAINKNGPGPWSDIASLMAM